MDNSLVILILAIAFEILLRWQIIPYITPFKRNRLKTFFFWMLVRAVFLGLCILINHLFF
jgi:hypothetical protein